jgi:hypothetical protein
MAISRMQQPRQMYGLGSLVKKAVKGVKSFVKSDLGKAALLAGGAYFAPTLFGRPAGFGSFGNLVKGGISSLGLDVASGAKPTLGQFGKVFAIGSLGGAALQALTASGADEEELGNIRDVESLKSYLRQGYKQLNPQAEPEQVEAFVETNTTEYRADGGRIGFAEGMPEEGIETLLPKPKPSEMMQGVDKTIQSIDNFAQLIAQSGSPSDMRGHMDLFSDFIQKNNVDAGPAFQYLKNRVKELKPGMERYIYISNEDMPVQKAVGGRINYEGGGSTDFEKWLEGKQKFEQGQNLEQLYEEYLEDKRRQKVAEQKTMAANGGRIGFFKGAQADARAGRGAMSPGTSMSGGFRGGGDGGGNKDTTPKISEVVKNISNLSNVPAFEKISNLESRYGLGSSGLPSRARHMAAMNVLSNALSKTGLGVAMGIPSKLAGDMGAFGMGLINEIPALGRGLTKENLSEIGEDIVDNFRGTFLTPNTMTTEQIYSNVYGRPGVRQGGRIGYAFGNPEQNAMEAAGIEGLPLNQNPAGVKELDLRDSGGFIPPVGVKEKADDIPAMLSNNEFVFTADAVRGMGDGDVNKGAQRMYDMMKKLEGGGRV